MELIFSDLEPSNPGKLRIRIFWIRDSFFFPISNAHPYSEEKTGKKRTEVKLSIDHYQKEKVRLKSSRSSSRMYMAKGKLHRQLKSNSLKINLKSVISCKLWSVHEMWESANPRIPITRSWISPFRDGRKNTFLHLSDSMTARLHVLGLDTSSTMPFPSITSKKKKFFKGSPLPDIALITSYEMYCKWP